MLKKLLCLVAVVAIAAGAGLQPANVAKPHLWVFCATWDVSKTESHTAALYCIASDLGTAEKEITAAILRRAAAAKITSLSGHAVDDWVIEELITAQKVWQATGQTPPPH